MNQEKCTTKKNKFQHLNYEERKIIERLLLGRTKKAEIARILQRNISTIKREIKKGTVIQKKTNTNYNKKAEAPEYIEYKRYFADAGQRVYKKRRERCGAKNKIIQCREFVDYVEESILAEKRWSPDTAVGNAKRNKNFSETVSTKTIYNWIDAGLMKVKNIDLLLKVKRKPKSKPKERKKVLGRSIDERPEYIDEREEFGHWEGDGIVGAGQKGHLITLVERKTGIGFIFNVKDKKEDKIINVLEGLKERYSKHYTDIFKTITFDNGSEFSRSDLMESDEKIMIYYAHPYSSWERAINENWNGIVRRFIPKGSSFDYLNDTDIQRINNYINTMPRKRLGYLTPLEMWNKEVAAILTA